MFHQGYTKLYSSYNEHQSRGIDLATVLGGYVSSSDDQSSWQDAVGDEDDEHLERPEGHTCM